MKNMSKKKKISLIVIGVLVIAVVLGIIIYKNKGAEMPLPETLQGENLTVAEVRNQKKVAKTEEAALKQAKEELGISTVSKEYSNTNPGFEVSYPSNFTIDAAHVYKGMGPGNDISGVAFVIPATTAKGTNLSTDSYVAFESLSKMDCVASDFLFGVSPSDETIMTVDGITYRVAHSVETAAGNIYDETVYVDDNCNAIRYYIHSTNLDNYEAGTVKQFDRAALIKIFDEVRKSYQSLQ